MKKFLNIFRKNKQPKTFESEFEKLTKELVGLCFEYVNYDDQNVEEIFILFSTEFDTIWFNVFYNINSQILKKHKVGDKYEINDGKQSLLNKEANNIIQKLIANFRYFSKDLPSDFRITYKTEGGKFDCNMNYEPIMENDPNATIHTICDEWIALEKNKL